tara:strand:+ start:3200 stop:3979 length:780 start_codon:yes stop_codon:yes gene_type:complete
MHETGDWGDPKAATAWGLWQTKRDLEDDRREMTDSVVKNMGNILKEVEAVAGQYSTLLREKFERTDLIGCEVPCKMKIGDIEFASHTDLMVRDSGNAFGFGKDRLLIFDWKWRQDVPTKAYLARNLQFATYWLMANQGTFLVEEWAGYCPIENAEDAKLVWIHLPYLKPFGRKTVVKDDDGTEREFLKGDTRPISSVLRHANYLPEHKEEITQAIVNRVEMYKSGFFPANPEPAKCHLCEAESFCYRFDTTPLEGDINE